MELVVNGKRNTISVDPERPLLWVLRNELDLTGPKYGCGEGECGACTVMIDGVAHRSCITPMGGVAGKEITTIEGIADGERLHPMQQAFIECDAMQCGYCTAGMIVSSVALLRKTPAPSETAIKEALAGNICRCGTYNRIVAAVRRASHNITASERSEHHASA
ncbi:MAG TPA: (2Fe-2S)-binding protein [Bryobacteraceae bacterium]|jgi:aerobic-type carbon monoxide dehydrogenase small subunit (CoxS/CutS family)|nr:(2Fe-2S)-binding protein [Bryobacteraceae bacterium]